MSTVQDDVAWFQEFQKGPQYAELKARPIAYFCAEFALDAHIPTYSGGLGILAGDVVREAADRQLPMVAIGLYYNQGYICKLHETGGHFVEVCQDIPPTSVGLEPVVDATGARVIVKVPLGEREIAVQAWVYHVGSVPVYLLDANVAENESNDQHITDRLYVGDKEVRLKQEIVLGIGGLRLLETLQVHPSLYHLNEGHSAFLTVELIRHEMHERGVGFQEALQFVRRRVVFTNHTLVPAGNDVFDNDLVSLMLSRYCQNLGIPVGDLIALGLVHQSSTFSMTMLSLRMAGVANGVSKSHAAKAKEIWTDHPLIGITNGVHVPTWDAIGADVSAEGAFWKVHQERKTKLLERIEAESGRTWDAGALLVGWARRITAYKRPLAILEEVEHIKAIASVADRPVHVVIAGQPHPSDANGMDMLRHIREVTEQQLPEVAVYLPSYDIQLAKLLVAGCDVWLNTPVVGFEASGTSGMKAALNGTLPCSTRDGWVAEVELYGIGWPLDSDHVTISALGVLEHEIVPMYYTRDAQGVPALWERHMRNARAMVRDRFSATRLLREYVQLLYS